MKVTNSGWRPKRRYGVQAARAAGMRAFAYTGGGMTPPERLAGLRTVLFDDMRRLPDLLTAAGAGDGRHTGEGLRPATACAFVSIQRYILRGVGWT